jgi:hypothetical protein
MDTPATSSQEPVETEAIAGHPEHCSRASHWSCARIVVEG